MSEPWTQSSTGKPIYLFAPEKTEIDIVDIAHGLAQLNRYGGSCRLPYNVGQHSVLASFVDPEVEPLQKLMHDAAERFVTDVLGPYKAREEFSFIRELESRWMFHIYSQLALMNLVPSKFLGETGIYPEEWWMTPAVHLADKIMLCVEAESLMTPNPFWTARREKLLAEGHQFKNLLRMSRDVAVYADVPWDFAVSKYQFIKRFCDLTGRDWPKGF